ncbi:hypothetical protein Tco_0157065 [Tanacetum coccineum]
MVNLPPPDHVADLPEDEPVQPKPAPIILHHAPAQPKGYVGNDDMEEDKEEDMDKDPEEEPIEQLDDDEELEEDGVGNDDDEELEEDRVGDDDDEEMEMDEDDEDNGGNNDEDDAEETKFAPPVVPIADANDELVPPVIQFGGNYHVGESSSTGTLLTGNGWVHAPGLMGCNLESVHRGVTRLDRQMFDMYKTEKRMAKKFKENEFRMNRHEYDITALDTVVRENRSDHSKMMKFVEGLSRQFNEQSRRAERLSRWEAWVRGRIPEELRFQEEPPIYPASAPRADDAYAMVRDAAIAAQMMLRMTPLHPGTHSPPSHVDSHVTRIIPLYEYSPIFFVFDRIMPPKGMLAALIQKLVADKVAEALEADRATRNNLNVAGGSGGNGGQGGAPPVRECTFAGFMKCGPTQFHGNEGVVELCLWFEKTKSVFRISDCAERTVPSEKKKVELYIKGLPKNIKGETTSSRPVVLNDAIRMAHTLMEQKIQDKAKRIAESNKRKWESNNNQAGGSNNNRNNNYRNNNHHNQYNNRSKGGPRAMTAAQNDGVDQG